MYVYRTQTEDIVQRYRTPHNMQVKDPVVIIIVSFTDYVIVVISLTDVGLPDVRYSTGVLVRTYVFYRSAINFNKVK